MPGTSPDITRITTYLTRITGSKLADEVRRAHDAQRLHQHEGAVLQVPLNADRRRFINAHAYQALLYTEWLRRNPTPTP